MTLSNDLYVSWASMCATVAGEQLPMNAIGPGVVAYVVRDCDPPLTLPDGDTVRQLSLVYRYEDYENELRT